MVIVMVRAVGVMKGDKVNGGDLRNLLQRMFLRLRSGAGGRRELGERREATRRKEMARAAGNVDNLDIVPGHL